MSETDAPEGLTHADINAIRIRILRGEKPSLEEMQGVVQAMRTNYTKAKPKEKEAKPKKGRAKVEKVDLGDLMTQEIAE